MAGTTASGVVIVGGGIVGVVPAYYLARAGVASVVVERDAIGSHASGFAYGGLNPVTRARIPRPLAQMAQAGRRGPPDPGPSVGPETGDGIAIPACPAPPPAYAPA